MCDKTPLGSNSHLPRLSQHLKEHLVLIRDGYLLRGILDKAAFGATEFSLVHAVHEAYGPHKAGLLLNSLGRLFTAYIQYYAGHSCRMEDLVLKRSADAERKKLITQAYNQGMRAAAAWADSEGGKTAIQDKDLPSTPLKPYEHAAAAKKIHSLLSGSEGASNAAALDSYMQGQLNPLASKNIKACLPNGLAVPFPHNTFSLMCSTGAKGSVVNQSQVSVGLGQQALEGRRVPRMSSGRTLPSFKPYDPNPRAGEENSADRVRVHAEPKLTLCFNCDVLQTASSPTGSSPASGRKSTTSTACPGEKASSTPPSRRPVPDTCRGAS